MRSPRHIYREVGRVEECCAYGCPHTVIYYETKTVAPTGGTKSYAGESGHYIASLFHDAQGRIYHQHIEPDASGSFTWFQRDDDWGTFGTVVDEDHGARTLLGQPLNPRTPTGPQWRPGSANAAA
ncbi:hypothetical protein [Aeromicrobium sp. CTD01-1L150]|uniref:hypothetical protein n=1 Tax=Aeromicrobium sp. CTD01-1L150 TaxID=3341830 RepID=UPI0035BEEE53